MQGQAEVFCTPVTPGARGHALKLLLAGQMRRLAWGPLLVLCNWIFGFQGLDVVYLPYSSHGS